MKPRAKTNSIRIIAGQWRGRRLPVLEVDGLRPTTDRVRETLFNWLMHDVSNARCLDLFAGSGALGLECLSRGASQSTFVESDRRVAAQLEKNIHTLGSENSAEVLMQSALNFLRQAGSRQYDLVFLDPPFDSGLLCQALPLLVDNNWLADGALVYLEQASKRPPEAVPHGWSIHKEGRAGYCRYGLYRT